MKKLFLIALCVGFLGCATPSYQAAKSTPNQPKEEEKTDKPEITLYDMVSDSFNLGLSMLFNSLLGW